MSILKPLVGPILIVIHLRTRIKILSLRRRFLRRPSPGPNARNFAGRAGPSHSTVTCPTRLPPRQTVRGTLPPSCARLVDPRARACANAQAISCRWTNQLPTKIRCARTKCDASRCLTPPAVPLGVLERGESEGSASGVVFFGERSQRARARESALFGPRSRPRFRARELRARGLERRARARDAQDPSSLAAHPRAGTHLAPGEGPQSTADASRHRAAGARLRRVPRPRRRARARRVLL